MTLDNTIKNLEKIVPIAPTYALSMKLEKICEIYEIYEICK
jgi:hypothetical protein